MHTAIFAIFGIYPCFSVIISIYLPFSQFFDFFKKIFVRFFREN